MVCNGNITIMLPWQPSNMFVTNIKLQILDLSIHIEPTSMVAMATVNNPRYIIPVAVYYLTTVACMSIILCKTFYPISTVAMVTY